MLNSRSASIASTPSAYSVTSMPSTHYSALAESSEGINPKERTKQHLRSQLGITEYHFSDSQPLHAAYQLYQAVLHALSLYDTHEWPQSKPTRMTIIKLFVAKSA